MATNRPSPGQSTSQRPRTARAKERPSTGETYGRGKAYPSTSKARYNPRAHTQHPALATESQRRSAGRQRHRRTRTLATDAARAAANDATSAPIRLFCFRLPTLRAWPSKRMRCNNRRSLLDHRCKSLISLQMNPHAERNANSGTPRAPRTGRADFCSPRSGNAVPDHLFFEFGWFLHSNYEKPVPLTGRSWLSAGGGSLVRCRGRLTP